ncbi:hypothetical protein CASFOL_034130 [Castilleja foliolosa]|uniref:Disease resistance N-terminal domain-containing protein n=1 Tax=Castilleja foliolosa TaxID=1961234 RepID=A0ABD3BXI9_9LAMI
MADAPIKKNNGGRRHRIPARKPPTAPHLPRGPRPSNQRHQKGKNLVERLEKDLRLFKAFLEDNSLRELVVQIRNVVYGAEDVIDAFVTQAAETKSRNYFLRALKTPVPLLNIAKDVEAAGSKVRDIYNDNKHRTGLQNWCTTPVLEEYRKIASKRFRKVDLKFIEEYDVSCLMHCSTAAAAGAVKSVKMKEEDLQKVRDELQSPLHHFIFSF